MHQQQLDCLVSWTVSDHSQQILSMLMVALFSLMNTLLLICLSLKSWRTFFTLTDRKLFYYYLRDRKLFYVRFFVTI